jgi:predicted dehydrogenase
MQVGVIGYGNQSRKILIILKKLKMINKIFVYKKKKFKKDLTGKIMTTNNLNNLDNVDIVFISSSSESHFAYIKYFINKSKFIFCEKPGITKLNEWNFLNNLNYSQKRKVYFNFNYNFSEYFLNIAKELTSKNNGKLINFSFYASHGKAFKNKKQKISNNIFENIQGNLGIHYINFFLRIFKNIKIINSHTMNVAKKNKDTSFIYLKSKNSFGTLFLSYASVAFKYAIIHFSNSILIFDNNHIKKYSPRDVFSNNGLFVTPKKKIINKLKKNHIQKTLDLSIKFFFKSINNNLLSVKDFNLAINSDKVLINMSKN